MEESKHKVVMEVDIHVAYKIIFESQKEPQKSSSQCSYFGHESEILRITQLTCSRPGPRPKPPDSEFVGFFFSQGINIVEDNG